MNLTLAIQRRRVDSKLATATAGVPVDLPGRPDWRLVPRRLEVELEEPELNNVIRIADEPVQNAGDVGRVDVRKIGRVERGRLRVRRAILVHHPVTLCSHQNISINAITVLKPDCCGYIKPRAQWAIKTCHYFGP